jgi:hypothetical protein
MGAARKPPAHLHNETMDYLSVREATEFLQVEPRSVTRYCASGRLEAGRVFGRWVIAEQDLVAFERPPSGRPRKAHGRGARARLDRAARAR